ncbi:MAG: hypothetical protein II977_01345, partial [Oscillospiraceae bacterium]|nr:hypothetical protein [Oscillospiraceae bacterium]
VPSAYFPFSGNKDSFFGDLHVLGEDGVHVWGSQQMGGEDAGFYYQLVPGCFFNLCCQDAHSDGKIYPGHNSKFVVDDSLLYRGTAVFVQAAIDYLNK